MAQSTRTFRVFLSSTFSDLKAGRKPFLKIVFPNPNIILNINPFVLHVG